jgi:carboxyl-terminal processing protease
MTVTLVGRKTVGKNVGSITIADEENGIKVGTATHCFKISEQSDKKSDYM